MVFNFKPDLCTNHWETKYHYSVLVINAPIFTGFELYKSNKLVPVVYKKKLVLQTFLKCKINYIKSDENLVRFCSKHYVYTCNEAPTQNE